MHRLLEWLLETFSPPHNEAMSARERERSRARFARLQERAFFDTTTEYGLRRKASLEKTGEEIL